LGVGEIALDFGKERSNKYHVSQGSVSNNSDPSDFGR